jgi:hypothetical protein
MQCESKKVRGVKGRERGEGNIKYTNISLIFIKAETEIFPD